MPPAPVLSLPAPAHPVSRDEALRRYGLCLRALGRPPRLSEYVAGTGVSRHFLDRLFDGWRGMPATFTAWAESQAGFAAEVRLLGLAAAAPTRPRRRSRVPFAALTGLPPLGAMTGTGWMANAPVNEQGVVVLFSTLLGQLGLRVIGVQCAFPDCLALREEGGGRWKQVRIEFEYESRSFETHGHDPAGCDLIVCWRHNWDGCPLEVLELSTLAS